MSHAAPTPPPLGRWGREAAAQNSVPQSTAQPGSQVGGQPVVQPGAQSWAQSAASQGWSSTGAQPAPGTARPAPQINLDILHNQWVIVGVSAFLGLLYIVSFLLTWAHYDEPYEEITINGIGFLTLPSNSESSMIGNVFLLPALGVVVSLGAGAYHLGFTDDRKRGYNELFLAGAVAAVFSLFALASGMLIGEFIEDDYGLLKGVGTSSGAGPFLCLFLSVVTLGFAAALYFTKRPTANSSTLFPVGALPPTSVSDPQSGEQPQAPFGGQPRGW
ncbi:hypothetical protein [Corynebacterium terpenotabidum]|uniref:hypothetical protein n=1 Tax=Corynebacterium terpenotabidum TaxID=89154 RepID=UPI0003F7D98C|nr:hypothetical protein [Corynebacterium terpenotabidum]